MLAVSTGSCHGVFARGATLVKRQSSSCVVGNPTSQNRANASSRSFFSQAGSRPSAFCWNSLNAAKYVSSCSVAVITFDVILQKLQPIAWNPWPARARIVLKCQTSDGRPHSGRWPLVADHLLHLRCFPLQLAIAALFQLQRQFRPAGAHDAA